MVDALKDEGHKDVNGNGVKHQDKYDFDTLTIVSNALLILVAGYDTTGQTLSYCGYELAKNPEVQRQLQAEIDAVIEENNGKLPDYNQTLGMKYLDMVFQETLRLHIAVPVIARACIRDYKMPGTDIIIKKGEEVFINAGGIHNDPDIYPNPEQFNPENFNEENKAKRHP